MPRVSVHGVELCYDEIGSGEPLILIMGLGAQMVLWDPAFCQTLADRGFRVIRFDNRDVGESSRMDHLPTPRLRRMLVRSALGLPVQAPYTLSDMAADTVGLMDALHLDSAHLVGASMGGMIAQLVAIEHPARVRTLTSIMSHPGDRWSRLAAPRALRALMTRMPRTRDEAIARQVQVFRVIGGLQGESDEERIRHLAGIAFDRGASPRGFIRQLAAIGAARSRVRALRSVRVPALILHGTHDPLILPWAARRTARALPNARLRMIQGMGHNLPEQAWPIIIDEITAMTRRSQPAM